MTAPVLPNTDLVAMAWLASLPGFSAAMVGTTLPKPVNGIYSWAATGFVLASTVGGSPHHEYALRRPVVQVEGWWVQPGSNKPAWGQANGLCESIVAATYNEQLVRAPLAMRTGVAGARVIRANALTEPRRKPGDQGDAAVYWFDLALDWTTR